MCAGFSFINVLVRLDSLNAYQLPKEFGGNRDRPNVLCN